MQNIRAAAIIQLLLGNIGRPGGGILALRGHATIQGSTDIPTLYDILPGYIPMPHADSGTDDLDELPRAERAHDRLRGANVRSTGEPAQGMVGRGGDDGERLRLRLPAAHRRRPLALADDARMLDGARARASS